jgi:transport and Golgi organization protein 2
MCTVTALPRALLARSFNAEPLLLRVACNRDEQITRAAGLPPAMWSAGPRNAVMPIDPQSGGTWMAANDSGVVFVLINANHGGPAKAGHYGAHGPAKAGHYRELSRGVIIPALVGSATVSEALARAQHLDAERYRPFRLLLIDRYQLVECWHDGDRLRHRRSFLYGALMRTSSGLGDAVVEAPRRALFRRCFADPHDPVAAQDRFHDHQWPGREAVSVNMRRHGARTVSQTIVEVGLETVSMSYRAIGPLCGSEDQPVVVQVAA